MSTQSGMGIFDWPAPALLTLDDALSGLPAGVRLALWGGLAGVLSMLLYRSVSPQQRIAAARTQLENTRRALYRHEDDSLSAAWPLIRQMLGLALRQLGLVVGPVILTGLPVLCLLIALGVRYSYVYPPGSQPVAVDVQPDYLRAHWQEQLAPDFESVPLRAPAVVISTRDGRWLTTVPVLAPVPVLHKWNPWNWLFGNPAGYLRDDLPVERIKLEMPQQRFLPWGPDWVRGWEFLFIALTAVSAAVTKWLLRIH
jgi:hypothetical protein